MIRVGKLLQISGNKVTFELDQEVDVVELKKKAENFIYANIDFYDSRTITPQQRKKVWALVKEIADFTFNKPEVIKKTLKNDFIEKTNVQPFSLSDCSVSVARDFINFIIEFCFEWNIPFHEKAIQLTDDVNTYLFLCIKYRKCAICGKKSDIHHVDTVGIGRDRRKVNNDENRLISLCREHHNEVHQIGQASFDQKHAVQGILVSNKTLKDLKM